MIGSALAAGGAGCATRSSGAQASVVVVGGGFAGASAARTLRRLLPAARVDLVEPKGLYTACPFSNLVLGGQRRIVEQQFSYAGLVRAGVRLHTQNAVDLDADRQFVVLGDGTRLNYDRLVVAPGIEVHAQALRGYDVDAMTVMPHAWQAGEQTEQLRRQLNAMPDGGLVVIAVPEPPFRCPPGPYERASLIAAYLQREKPRSKLLILDAQEQFSKQALFEQGWSQHYAGVIERWGASDGARVIAVDASTRTLETEFERVRADVANVIPPQRAAAVARRFGLTNDSGWCPVEPLTFLSRQVPGVHVIGDAAILNAMPKSAFAANAQAGLCAVQIARALTGQAPADLKLMNTCYSLLAPDHGISVAGVYRAAGDRWLEVPGSGGSSPLSAQPGGRAREARHARAWFTHLTTQVFG